MNHFLEYDEENDGNMAAITLHFGSRNFGVKVCKYWTLISKSSPLSKKEVKDLTREFKESYLKEHGKKDMKNFKTSLDSYLETKKAGYIGGYLRGENMDGYLCDMCFAQAYASYNHLVVQERISKILQKFGIKVSRVIKTTHNYIDLQDRCLRKSAIRSYLGEEILVPFNMRDGVAICEGLSNESWLNSCSHGAGRRLSRGKAKENITLEEFKKSMEGIYSTSISTGTIDESPEAYKDTEEIKLLIQETCKIKTLLVPKINIKASGE